MGCESAASTLSRLSRQGCRNVTTTHKQAWAYLEYPMYLKALPRRLAHIPLWISLRRRFVIFVCLISEVVDLEATDLLPDEVGQIPGQNQRLGLLLHG